MRRWISTPVKFLSSNTQDFIEVLPSRYPVVSRLTNS